MVGRICPRRGHLGELLLICLKGCTYGDTLLLLICGERMLSLLLGSFCSKNCRADSVGGDGMSLDDDADAVRISFWKIEVNLTSNFSLLDAMILVWRDLRSFVRELWVIHFGLQCVLWWVQYIGYWKGIVCWLCMRCGRRLLGM